MSAKNLDSKGRFRARTIGFRVSPEEDQLINSAVALSGLTKQDYIVKRLLCRDVVVQGNPRVYKALKNQLAEVLDELKRINNGSAVDDELLSTIQLITTTLNGLKGDSYCAMRTSADFSSKPTAIPSCFCVIPLKSRMRCILSPIMLMVVHSL